MNKVFTAAMCSCANAFVPYTLLSKEDHQTFQQIVRYMDIEKLHHDFKLTPARFSAGREHGRGFGGGRSRFGRRRPGWGRR